MYLAILSRDVENADLFAGPASRVCAHNDRCPGHQRLPAEAIHEGLRNCETFAFHQHRLAIGAFGLDDQVHVRILPVELRHLPFDQYFLRRVEYALAVMRERSRAEGTGRCKNKDSHRSHSHVVTS
jgi:hypothetical protein